MSLEESEDADMQPLRLSRPLTVCQVIPTLVAGGAERGAVDIAAALVAAGGRAIVVSGGGPMVHELTRAGAKHIEMNVASKNPFTIRRNARLLAKLVRSERIDILHARSRAPAWSAWRAARKTKTPFVTTFHAAYKFKSEAKRRYNAVMAKGDRMIAVSDYIADYIRKFYAPEESRIVTIPRGIDFVRFDRARVSDERMVKLLSAWRVPDDLRVLLMPARLSRIKGHSILIEALAQRLRAGKRDIYTVIVGATEEKDPYRRELEALIAKRGLEGLVRIVDHCADMPAAYALASAVVAPSIVPEGFGRVPVEAQAMGRPVIATDIGGFRETIAQGETGLLIPPGDVTALAQAIDAVFGLSAEERAALGDAAAARARQLYSKEKMCAATLGVYAELTNAIAAAGRSP